MRRERRGMRRAAGIAVLLVVMVAAGPDPDHARVPLIASTTDHTFVPQITATSTESATGVPILLVPGWFDTARDLAALRIRLVASGWPTDYVETITFEDPAGSNRVHAVELAAAVGSLVARTGADEVDIVAHSMGGLATRWYLRGTPDAPPIGAPFRRTSRGVADGPR